MSYRIRDIIQGDTSPMTLQQKNEALLKTIYTPEKKKIWDKEMEKAGKKFVNDEMSFDKYVDFRRKLRTRLGFPA